MQKRTISIIIIITSTALAGILLTQLYWVRTAFTLKEEQFDNSVRIAVKSVINQLQQNQYDSTYQDNLMILSCRKDRLEVGDYINPLTLDSLIHDELKCMAINSNFYYGVYNKYNNRFYMGNYDGYAIDLLNADHQFSLASVYKPGDYYLSIVFTNKTHILLHRMELWVFLSVLFVMILIISFISVIYTIVQQKKISEIKTDFINNMTHEFKTPIATSTLAAEMIQKDEVISNSDKIKKYSSIILDENNRLQSQVEQVLQVAILESGQQQFKIRRININKILIAAINTLELRIKDENITLIQDIKAVNPYFIGDKSHIINVFYNLIDNAMKYKTSNPKITISTYNVNNSVVVSVKDNGIGISKEHQKHIFKNLYRVPTGNLHEVRGFGLGLYYVKTIVDQFSGKIELVSEPGVGSDFKIVFPLVDIKPINHERG